VYKAVLVEDDIKIGREILTALDNAQILTTGLLWLYVAELEEWQLLIASSLVDRKGPRSAFMEFWKVLQRADLLQRAPLRRISLVTQNDKLVMALRRAYGPSKFVSEFRITSAYVGNLFLDEAYIYKLAPLHAR
jgi:hypothetical protein